jgi:hypothetical protein
MDSWLENFARAVFRRSADTAHDLKTPLNVAVLNLELLRMRLRKLECDGDEKIVNSARAIDVELRRMGRIFDAFFLLSTPPSNDGPPVAVDLGPIIADAAEAASLAIAMDGDVTALAHESRIRQAVQLFCDGASRLFIAEQRTAAVTRDDRWCHLTVTGTPAAPDFEPSRIFKFYYSGPDGSPDLSLAVARLIAETYGGELNAVGERDKVALRLSFPLGAK